MSRAKILLISPQPFFQWRGSPIRVGFNAMALSESGYDVNLLVMPVGEPREIPGVRIIRPLNIPGVRNLPIGPSLTKAILDVFLFFTALRLAFKNRYAVIHGIEDAGPIAVVAAALTGAGMIFEKHSDPGSYRKGLLRNLVMWLYGKVEAFSIRHADAVIGTGPALVKQALEIAPNKPAHHIFDIPSSLVEANLETVKKVRAQLQKEVGELLAVYVGSFAVYQGIDLMFESMPDVVKRHGRVRFVVIGGTKAEIEQKKAWLAQRGIEQNVSFIGKIPPDELPNYLSAADILLSPRIAGTNTPLKLLDYLKAGGAIVASDNEANRLILDESTAMLVRPEPAEFAAGVCRLVEDPALRRRLAEKGRGLIDQTYNYAEFKRRLQRCYEQVLARSGKK